MFYLLFIFAVLSNFSHLYRSVVGYLVKSPHVAPTPFFSVPAATSPSTGLYQSLLHLAKLTGLLGSPETRHLTDLLTVSPLQITPSLSAHITLPSPCLHDLFFHQRVSVCLTSFLLLFPLPVSLPSLFVLSPPLCFLYLSNYIFLRPVS